MFEESILSRLRSSKITNMQLMYNLETTLGIIGCSLNRSPERFKSILPNWRIESQRWLEDVVVSSILQIDSLIDINETVCTEESIEYHLILFSIVNALVKNNANSDDLYKEFSDYHVDVVKIYNEIKYRKFNSNSEFLQIFKKTLKLHVEKRKSERASLLEESYYEVVGGGANGERVYKRSGEPIGDVGNRSSNGEGVG